MHLLTPGLKETEMADFPPLSYTSTIEIPTLSYTKSLKKLPLLGEPPCIGHHREYPPPPFPAYVTESVIMHVR